MNECDNISHHTTIPRVFNFISALQKVDIQHSYDILGAGMLWKPKEARILTNFIDQPVNIR